jgi:hypothetical protein
MQNKLTAQEIIDSPNTYLGKHICFNNQKGVIAGVYDNKWVLIRFNRHVEKNQLPEHATTLFKQIAGKINKICGVKISWAQSILSDSKNYYWVWLSSEAILDPNTNLTYVLGLIQKELT